MSTTVRERPILFSGPMIRAILDGRKTQTRRIVKPQPPTWIDRFGYTAFTPPGHISGRGVIETEGPAEKFFRLKYGATGDRLWVRETWATRPAWDHVPPREIPRGYAVYRRADPAEAEVPVMWRPSIHMPRWASRITLEITEVRVERLQEISEADAIAEGFYSPRDLRMTSARDRFRLFWDVLNGKTHPWQSNPWVWCISFRRLEGNP